MEVKLIFWPPDKLKDDGSTSTCRLLLNVKSNRQKPAAQLNVKKLTLLQLDHGTANCQYLFIHGDK